MSYGDDCNIWNAVSEVVETVMHLETHADEQKLERMLRSYYAKGAKNLEFRSSKSLLELVNEYADNVYQSLFSGLSERKWVAEADFLLCLDAGVKDYFPAKLIRSVPQETFERIVLEAHDRSFDEVRCINVCWQTVNIVIQGKLTQKKVRTALDEARLETVKQGFDTVLEFLSCWTFTTVELIAKTAEVAPQAVLPVDLAVHLFDTLIQALALPLPLTQTEGQPPAGWHVIEECVRQAYSSYAGAILQDPLEEIAGMNFKPAGMKGKGKGKGKFGGKFAPF